jgi:hypothetical protein
MIQTFEATRSAKSGEFNVVLIHIGTILHLSEARKKIRTPSGIKLQCDFDRNAEKSAVSDVRYCKKCGKELHVKQEVFCSINCLSKHHAALPRDGFNQNRAPRNTAILLNIKCKECGKAFLQKNKTQTTCSRSCNAKIANRARSTKNALRKM